MRIEYSEIAKQSSLLDKEIDALMVNHAGKWVVFRRGKVISFHATEDQAIDAAESEFGRDASYVVAQIGRRDPIQLSPFWHNSAASTR
jgi:hypothetical protein